MKRYKLIPFVLVWLVFIAIILGTEFANKSLEFSLISEEPRKGGIECFDISETEKIAIGKNGINDKILVYDINGNYLYGYKFNTDGTFFVEWENELLNVYLVRGSTRVTLDSLGNIINRLDLSEEEFNTKLEKISSVEKERLGTKVKLEKGENFFSLLSTSYSKISASIDGGGKSIIYDGNTLVLIDSILHWVLVGGMFVAVVGYFVIAFIKYKSKK